MSKVLVLDANQRSALAIIRSLGRRGVTVLAGDHMAQPIGAASRYAAASVAYPDPARTPRGFVEEIAAIARRLGIDTIVPATDLTTMLLASQSGLREICRVACPDEAGYEALTDKATLVRLANELGVLIPETRIAGTPMEIERAVADFGYPVVLKPARSRFVSDDRIVSTSVLIVDAPDQLSEAVNRLQGLGRIACLVQRFIPGRGAGIFALCGKDGPLVWFAHRRLREKPPAGGVSVLSEGVPLDLAMQTAATKLLSAARWVGVAMVEFRVTDDGKPYLMEVNGRFWGSLQLAVDSGVDFPWLLYQLVQGLPVSAPTSYAVAKRLRWLLGDLDNLLLQLRQSDIGLSGKATAIGAFMRSFADMSCRQEVLRISDPGPGIREATQWLRALRRAPVG